MKFKKGQAAMEFLMTYGWAILVVIGIIAALAYFGVLSPGKLIPDKCIAEPPIGVCHEYQVAENEITIILRNSGTSVDVDSVSITGSSTCTTIVEDLADDRWDNNELMELTLTGCTYGLGEKAQVTFDIGYTEVGKTLPHIYSGELSGTVEVAAAAP
ncbi:hypothetical protein ACFL1H_04980 [Nanoarchaeota archaeon]